MENISLRLFAIPHDINRQKFIALNRYLDRIKNLKSRIPHHFIFDFNRNNDSLTFVAGTGRSGTTWLSELINYSNRYRYIFEPFDNLRNDLWAPFEPRQYVRPSNRDKTFIEPARRILLGRFRNVWSDSANKAIFPRRRLIKDIRANLMLKWFKEAIIDCPMILLLRHPVAIAQSWARLNWGDEFDTFLNQQELLDDYLRPFEKYIRDARNDFDKVIMFWCIENYVPLKQFSQREVLVVFYEQLLLDPKNEIKQIFDFIGLAFDESVLNNVRSPSRTTRKSRGTFAASIPLDSWRDNVTQNQLERATEILQLFGLDKIYDEGPMPKTSNALGLL